MNGEELKLKQEEMHDLIKKHAEELGLSNDKTKPILDGVYDESAYLDAPLRIMWIMKEAYDDKDENGNSCGGDWSIFDILDENKPIPQSWYRIIYATYGIFNKKNHVDMYSIRQKPSMKDVLYKIAYINLNKMPAYKKSSDADLEENYKIWKDVLIKQIDLYNPQVIVFGNTFDFFRKDLVGGTEPFIIEEGLIQVFRRKGALLFHAYHPNNRVKGVTTPKYVDSIINPCLKEFWSIE